MGSLELGGLNDFPMKISLNTIEGNVSVPKRLRKQLLLREILMAFPKVRKTYCQTVEIIALMNHYQPMEQNKELHGISLRRLLKKIIIDWELEKPLRNSEHVSENNRLRISKTL